MEIESQLDQDVLAPVSSEDGFRLDLIMPTALRSIPTDHPLAQAVREGRRKIVERILRAWWIENGIDAPESTSEGFAGRTKFHIGVTSTQEYQKPTKGHSSSSPPPHISLCGMPSSEGFSKSSDKHSLHRPSYEPITEVSTQSTSGSDDSGDLRKRQQKLDSIIQFSCMKIASSHFALIDEHRQHIIRSTGWNALRELSADEIETSLNAIATLGSGSLGVVQEVQAPSRSSFVRKRVFLPRRTRKQLLEIVQAEAKAVENLIHVHIVHIMGAYELEGRSKSDTPSFSLLMYPVGDRDLATLLNDIHEDDAPGSVWLPQWFSCLTSALAYMHSQGVRHQDIKPSNIIHLGPHVYFTDFGSSAQFNPECTTSTADPARSSAMYSPLEMLNRFEGPDSNYSRHGTGSDTFSLGCVFAEMLTVLSGNSVSDLQDYLRQHKSRATGVCYAYHTEFMHNYFEMHCNEYLYEVYDMVIRPMLRRDRKERPSARQLLKTLSKLEFLPSSCGCSPLKVFES